MASKALFPDAEVLSIIAAGKTVWGVGPSEGFRPEALNKAGKGQAWLEGADMGRPPGERSCVGQTAQPGRVGMSPRSPPVRKAPPNGCLGWARSRGRSVLVGTSGGTTCLVAYELV